MNLARINAFHGHTLRFLLKAQCNFEVLVPAQFSATEAGVFVTGMANAQNTAHLQVRLHC